MDSRRQTRRRRCARVDDTERLTKLPASLHRAGTVASTVALWRRRHRHRHHRVCLQAGWTTRTAQWDRDHSARTPGLPLRRRLRVLLEQRPVRSALDPHRGGDRSMAVQPHRRARGHARVGRCCGRLGHQPDPALRRPRGDRHPAHEQPIGPLAISRMAAGPAAGAAGGLAALSVGGREPASDAGGHRRVLATPRRTGPVELTTRRALATR